MQRLHVGAGAEGAIELAGERLHLSCSPGLGGVPGAGRARSPWAFGRCEPAFIVLSGLSTQVLCDETPKIGGTGGTECQELLQACRQSVLAPFRPM